MSNRPISEKSKPILEKLEQEKLEDDNCDQIFKRIVEFSNDAIAVTQDGKTVYRNPVCERLTGYSVDETKDRSFLEIIAPEFRNEVGKYHELRMNGDTEPVECEVEILTKEGKRVPLEIRASFMGYRGRPATVAVMRDITLRKESEEIHRKSRKEYRKLYDLMRLMADNVPDLIWAKDIRDRYCFVNRSICEWLLKCSSTDEPLGKTDLFFAERERKAGHDHTFGEICVDSDGIVKKSNRPGRFLEGGLVRGEYLLLDVHKAPLYNENGEMIGTVGCGRDVTKEKEKDEILRTSEKRFRKLIEDVSGISIQGYDENRNVTFWNPASEKLYGYTEEEALGKRLEDLIIPEHMREEVRTLHSRWLSHDEKIPPGELVLMDKFGNDVAVYSSHVMLVTSQGKEMFCIDLDMNPISRVEKEKKRLQAQLQQSQKMEAIGTLAGGIAHDFNNILQAISGYAEIMILERTEAEQDCRNVNAIKKASRRAAKLVQQLLLFSRKADIQKRPLRINNEVKQAESLLKKTIPKMIEIEVKLSGELWNVNVDPVQIEQVILNLGSNAADAMPYGGKIVIETANRTLDREYVRNHIGAVSGDYVLLSISDTGTGMDLETRGKIFEPFFTTKEPGKGTGLGLASVYGIVKSHDGYIACSSEQDRGTKFEIYLPALKQRVPKLKKETFGLENGTETLLVVDDEEAVRGLATKALKRYGYSVLTASNGEEALDIYGRKRDKIALVVLDISMPRMGGHECLKALLSIDPSVKVVIASGYTSNTHIRESLERGAKRHIRKPYQFSELVKYVRQILDEET